MNLVMMLGQWRKKFNDSKELHAPRRNNQTPFTYYIAQQQKIKKELFSVIAV